MDKLNFNLNQLLRFLLGGGWTVMCYFFTNPNAYNNFKNDNILDLVLISLVLGSIIYVIHRAIIYPIVFKLVCIGLFLIKRIKWDQSFLIPFIPSRLEMDMDFRRWQLRKNDKSLIENLIDWGSQVHFLYCSSLGSLVTIIFSKLMGGYEKENISYVWISFVILIVCGFINNSRLLLYDIELRKREGTRV